AEYDLDQEACDTQCDQESTEGSDDEPDLQRGVLKVVETACHTHEAQDIQRCKGEPETNHPEPERAFAPERIQLVAKGFGEPVGDGSKDTEHHTANNHVMEVSNQEQTVMQHKVCRWDCQHHTSHTADDEGQHEGDSPHHGQFEANAATIHGEQPVEDLGASRDRNDHGGDTEERVHTGTCTHSEEVVQPYQIGHHGNDDRGVNHRGVTEQALAAERSNNFGVHTKQRQDQDVNLGVTPDPDHVDVHHRVAAQVIREEVHAQVAVQNQQCQCSCQNREGSNDQHVGTQRCPGKDRHF